MSFKTLKLGSWIRIIAVGMLAIFIVQFILVFVIRVPRLSTGKTRQSTSSVGKFAISYPEQWQWIETPSGYAGDLTVVALLAYPDPTKLGVYGSIRRSVSSYDSIEEVSKWGEQIAFSQQDYKQISFEPSSINGEDTRLREYTSVTPVSPIMGSSSRHCVDNYRLRNRIGYIITLCVDEEDYTSSESIFRQIVDSFSYQG